MAPVNLMQLGDQATLDVAPTSYLEKAIKCFLCDWKFCAGEEPWLLFEKRYSEDGQAENSLATILSSALSCELHESTSHSALLCEACKTIILEYESQEQRFCEMRYRILSSYNSTAKKNDLQPIAVEVNGVLQDIYQTTIKEEEEVLNVNGYFDIMSKQQQQQLTTIQSDDEQQQQIPQPDDEEQQQHVESQNQTEYMPLSCEPQVPNGIQISDFIAYDDIIEEDDFQSEYAEPDLSEEHDDCSQDNAFLDPTSEILFNINNETENSNGNSLLSSLSGALPLPVDEHTLNDGHENDHNGFFVREGEQFLCEMCTDVLPLGLADFIRHMSDAHSLIVYPCQQCGNGYLNRKDLSGHIANQHPDAARKYECKPCGHSFSDFQEFRLHRRQHYANARPHQCTVCAKRYASRNQLNEHMNMHTGERPFKCPQCNKQFHSKYSLQTHAKIHTERQREFACDKCDKSFLKQHNLNQHKKLHSSDRAHVCDLCSKSFSTSHNLDIHKIVHSGQKPFVCPICNKAFARRAEIRDHLRTHTGERPFQCDLCPSAFAQRSNLMSHRKTTHLNQKLHNCMHCNRSFKRRRLLDYHIKSVHTGERPHKCEICGAAFVYPEHYKKHMIIHSAHKPYACEVCGKQFSSRDNRNAHRFVHSTKKPYECVQCGAGFMRKPLLLTHMKQSQHLMGTIIVNQPLIKGFEFASSSRNNADDLDLSTMDGVVAATQPIGHIDDIRLDEDEEDVVGHLQSHEHVESNADNALAQLTNELLADDDDDEDMKNIDMGTIVHVSQELIKNEIGDVKYMQFEELTGDGQETFTWVDIGTDKD